VSTKSSVQDAEAYNGSDLSLEFLMGRALDNAMLNVGQKDTAESKTSSDMFGEGNF